MNRINRTIVKKILIGILLTGSILALFVNKGLYFFELNDNIQVHITGEESEVDNFISSFEDSTLIRKDITNNSIYFESKGTEDINNSLNELNTEDKFIFEVSENGSNRRESLLNYSAFIILLVITSIFIFTYYLLKNKNNLSSKQYLYLVLSYGIVAFFSNLYLAGFISLLSRYYQIRELELISFLVMNIWLSVITFTSFWRLKVEEFDEISSLYATQEFINRRYFYMLILIVLSVTFGLGTNFIITATLILLGIWVANFNITNLGIYLSFKIKVPRPSISKQSQKLQKNKELPNNPKKKKSKIKKKKRR